MKPLYDYNFIDIIHIFLRHKRIFLFVFIFSLITSIVVSYILPIYYQSVAIILPNNLTLADKNTIFGDNQNNSEFSYYGNKYDAYRILSIANSNTVLDYVVNKYNLKKHYNIDKNEKYPLSRAKENFTKNYSVLKNEREAIEISLFDKDKHFAANVINDIIYFIDSISVAPVMESKFQVIKMLKIQLQKNSSKSDLRVEELNTIRKALSEYEVSANDKISSITILQKAFPAEKKSKPIRSTIVIFSVLSSLILTLLIIIFYHQYIYIRKYTNDK